MPVVALVLGIVIRHERIAPVSILGAAICLAGAWIIRMAGVRERSVRPVRARITTAAGSLG
jgi:drug/metabolite transporter (DMT)-like permease